MRVDNTYPLCNKNAEDESRLFRDCQVVSHVWRALDLGINTQQDTSIVIQDWITNFMNCMWKEDEPNSSHASNFVANFWGIWLHRNAVVFRNLTPHPRSILEITKKACTDNEEGIEIRQREAEKKIRDQNIHSRPVVILKGDFNTSGFKLLVDGAWKRKKNGDSVVAIGWIIMHDQITIAKGGGRIIASSAIQAEGYSILRGLIEVTQRNIKQITTLSDNRVICSLLKEGRTGALEIAGILEDIRVTAVMFDFCSIVNVSRNNITPAHDLVVAARKHGMVA
ncbi:uncharacterized protein [Spinacia oleracea]|uniref:RNase H type-1 domain-containing protein n=1 Tax=Spinacia oleracea TaxID=3562 RepID=A0A9R0K8A3_SPIOL|nr:uncharacterized protein LOC110801239 [Spinacia oleracea]